MSGVDVLSESGMLAMGLRFFSPTNFGQINY